MRRLSFLLVSLILVLSSCGNEKQQVYKLYYLGGQSNMDGYGYISDLPAELTTGFEGVYIYHGNPARDDASPDGRGLWTQLQPGHGAGFSTDGTTNNYSGRFGVELQFAREMESLHPNYSIAIIKYSLGGTSIDKDAAGSFGNWDPTYGNGEGINQYDHFLATVNKALEVADIDGDGMPDKLVPSGIIWIQGESDGTHTEEIAARYFDNLSTLMGLFRAKFDDPELPVVVGRISDSGNNESGRVWQFGDIIREAQSRFATVDENAAIVTSTDKYSYSDPWHYDSGGFIDLGTEFARALDSITVK